MSYPALITRVGVVAEECPTCGHSWAAGYYDWSVDDAGNPVLDGVQECPDCGHKFSVGVG